MTERLHIERVGTIVADGVDIEGADNILFDEGVYEGIGDDVQTVLMGVLDWMASGAQFAKANMSLSTGDGAAGTLDFTCQLEDLLGTPIVVNVPVLVRLFLVGAGNVLSQVADATVTMATGTRTYSGIEMHLRTTDAAGSFSGSFSGLTAGARYLVTTELIGLGYIIHRSTSALAHA